MHSLGKRAEVMSLSRVRLPPSPPLAHRGFSHRWSELRRREEMGGIGARSKRLLAGGTAAALFASLGIAHVGGYFIVHTFTGQGDGAMPAAALIRDRAGYLYGTTDAGGRYFAGSGVVFRIAPDGTETVLYLFCSLSNCTDGSEPYGAMVRNGAGNLYGTTYSGALGHHT
jgi:uncharacterized repeat protein (TIGR03803 family)